MREITFEEANLVSGGTAVEDIIGGVAGIGGGAIGVGGGLALDAGLAATLAIGGGVVVGVAGVALLGYGIIELVDES